MIVGWIQEHLEGIYARRAEMRAQQFVIDDVERARRMGFRTDGEELLVGEYDDGSVGVALFYARSLLDEGSETLHRGVHPLECGFDGYCQLLEGVSHFLYLDCVQDEGRQVSRLELELQAEIDKFASCVLARWSEGASWALHVREQLFENFRLRDGLEASAQHRYTEANRVAAGYCNRLMGHVRNRQRDRLLADLRYSYRLGAEAKMRHLVRSA